MNEINQLPQLFEPDFSANRPADSVLIEIGASVGLGENTASKYGRALVDYYQAKATPSCDILALAIAAGAVHDVDDDGTQSVLLETAQLYQFIDSLIAHHSKAARPAKRADLIEIGASVGLGENTSVRYGSALLARCQLISKPARAAPIPDLVPLAIAAGAMHDIDEDARQSVLFTEDQLQQFVNVVLASQAPPSNAPAGQEPTISECLEQGPNEEKKQEMFGFQRPR